MQADTTRKNLKIKFVDEVQQFQNGELLLNNSQSSFFLKTNFEEINFILLCDNNDNS